MLGVNAAMANRALNLLAAKNLLIRHRSRGTFVGPGFDSGATDARTAVHMIEILCGNTTSDMQAGEMMSFGEALIRASICRMSTSTRPKSDG